jgi:type II restriction enzyme
MRFLNAEEFFDELYPNVVYKEGKIVFELNDIEVTINTKDSIGHMLQDWITEWARINDIYLRANPSTQEFPDFYLSDSNEDYLLEIKSFDYNASPNFDVANFETYVRSLLENPKKIDASYIVFGYSLKNGKIKIEALWLKKIWELCTNSHDWALRIQQKQGTIYNIRPVNFVSMRGNIAQPFATKQDFLLAIQAVLNQYEKTKFTHTDWIYDFNKQYYDVTGILLFS